MKLSDTPDYKRGRYDLLNIYAWTPQVTTLGPGLRFAMWVQGCPFRCAGCMTPDSLPFSGGEKLAVDFMVGRILATNDIEGLTISGGEPFMQAAGLSQLVQKVRQERDIGVIVYTGYKLSALRRMAESKGVIDSLLAQTDLLIDGPYMAAHNSGMPLRGSTNQRLHLLTARYRHSMNVYDVGQVRQVEIHLTGREAMLVGIPSQRQLALWKDWKQMN